MPNPKTAARRVVTIQKPAADDWEWARKFIAEWLSICPEIEPDIMDMRDDYLTDPEIAHRLLDGVGQVFAAIAPRFDGPPGILTGMEVSDAIHPDDIAVDRFAVAMKAKLAIARSKGRGGWQGCREHDLMEMLSAHVAKGDMRDVANLAMMIHLNREDGRD